MLLLTQGNALRIPLADESVHCVVTSPPYWGLRDYGIGDQLGLEPTPEEYVENMVAVFREVRRVLRSDGQVWLNMGDCYASSANGRPADEIVNDDRRFRDKPFSTVVGGLKPKDLCGIPWRVAFALQADGWWLRSDIIWSKPNPMPESVTDRPTKAHEYLFLLTKSARYYYDADAVREPQTGTAHSKGTKLHPPIEDAGIGHKDWHKYTPNTVVPGGRNRRTVWHIATAPYSGAHFATYPPALVEPCIKAGTSERGVCPECGAPWERVTESKQVLLQETNNPGKQDEVTNWERDRWPRTRKESTTLGWQRTCECGTFEPAIPATVFDPFAGSGTTLQVARQLSRNGIGLDLSLEYLHLARQRLSLDALENWTEGVATSDDGKDSAHKNKNVPGQVTHSFHASRQEKDVTDLPLFEEL